MTTSAAAPPQFDRATRDTSRIVAIHGAQDGLRWGYLSFGVRHKRRFFWDRLNGRLRLWPMVVRKARTWGRICAQEVRDPDEIAEALALLEGAP